MFQMKDADFICRILYVVQSFFFINVHHQTEYVKEMIKDANLWSYFIDNFDKKTLSLQKAFNNAYKAGKFFVLFGFWCIPLHCLG